MNIEKKWEYKDLFLANMKEGLWKLKHLLESLSKHDGLKLFDGESYMDPRELLEDPELGEFLDLEVKFDEYGIHDFYVRTDKPLFTFALNCPYCGRLTQIPLLKKVRPAEYCGCTGKKGGTIFFRKF